MLDRTGYTEKHKDFFRSADGRRANSASVCRRGKKLASWCVWGHLVPPPTRTMTDWLYLGGVRGFVFLHVHLQSCLIFRKIWHVQSRWCSRTNTKKTKPDSTSRLTEVTTVQKSFQGNSQHSTHVSSELFVLCWLINAGRYHPVAEETWLNLHGKSWQQWSWSIAFMVTWRRKQETIKENEKWKKEKVKVQLGTRAEHEQQLETLCEAHQLLSFYWNYGDLYSLPLIQPHNKLLFEDQKKPTPVSRRPFFTMKSLFHVKLCEKNCSYLDA